jgi:hypothetical protein
MHYPVLQYPTKVNLSLDKTPVFKVSYQVSRAILILTGTVFNVRGSEGYVVNISL